jgi:hypothetical protein
MHTRVASAWGYFVPATSAPIRLDLLTQHLFYADAE